MVAGYVNLLLFFRREGIIVLSDSDDNVDTHEGLNVNDSIGAPIILSSSGNELSDSDFVSESPSIPKQPG